MDYTLYRTRDGKRVADTKRLAYIKRHGVREKWTDPKKPGTLSRYILWEYPTVATAMQKYNRRFRNFK
jgi:hypothetical protein